MSAEARDTTRYEEGPPYWDLVRDKPTWIPRLAVNIGSGAVALEECWTVPAATPTLSDKAVARYCRQDRVTRLMLAMGFAMAAMAIGALFLVGALLNISISVNPYVALAMCLGGIVLVGTVRIAARESLQERDE
jgi:hypothetical protein